MTVTLCNKYRSPEEAEKQTAQAGDKSFSLIAAIQSMGLASRPVS